MTNEMPSSEAPAESQPASPTTAEAAAAPDAPPAEAALVSGTPAPAPASGPSRRDHMLGTAGRVVGVVGIVLCLVLAVGVLVGRGWAVGTVDDVSATVNAQIAKTDPLLTQASARVGEISGRVSTVSDIAAGIAANPSPGGAVADTLRTGLAGISDRYQALRASYADLRESATSAISRLQTLSRIVPGFSVPQGPVDALAALDAKIQDFDATVNGLITIDPGQGPINQAAAAVAQKANDINAKLDGVQSGIADVQARIAALQAQIADAAGSIKLGVTLGSVGSILVLVYIAFLHWVLFRHASELRGRTTAA